MKPSEALKVARYRIESNDQYFICLALPYNSAGMVVRDYISDAIGGSVASYKTWLIENHENIFKGMTGADVTNGRLQWIDWMIEQYEGIGQ